MLGHRKAIAAFQSDFYKKYYHIFLKLSFLITVLTCLMLFVVFYLLLTREEPVYYANTPDGKIFLMPQPKG